MCACPVTTPTGWCSHKGAKQLGFLWSAKLGMEDIYLPAWGRLLNCQYVNLIIRRIHWKSLKSGDSLKKLIRQVFIPFIKDWFCFLFCSQYHALYFSAYHPIESRKICSSIPVFYTITNVQHLTYILTKVASTSV